MNRFDVYLLWQSQDLFGVEHFQDKLLPRSFEEGWVAVIRFKILNLKCYRNINRFPKLATIFYNKFSFFIMEILK